MEIWHDVAHVLQNLENSISAKASFTSYPELHPRIRITSKQEMEELSILKIYQLNI